MRNIFLKYRYMFAAAFSLLNIEISILKKKVPCYTEWGPTDRNDLATAVVQDILYTDHVIILSAVQQTAFWLTGLTELSRKGKPKISHTNKKVLSFLTERRLLKWASVMHTSEKMLTGSYF